MNDNNLMKDIEDHHQLKDNYQLKDNLDKTQSIELFELE
jgi:hypothetical protein